MDEQTKSRMTTTRRKKTRDGMNWLKSSLFERDVIMSVDEGCTFTLWLEKWMNDFKWTERYL